MNPAQASSFKHKLKSAIVALVAIRVLVLTVCAFLPLSLPGIWRQTDTMGVALRYWLRWTAESGKNGLILPAVLNSGDTSGIMPMEFPALNAAFAPFFALGPYWGRVLCMLGVLCLVHGLIYFNYRAWKKNDQTLGVESFGFVLIAIATFSSGWTGKFIPDLISVLLILLGVGMSWEKTSPIKSAALCALGILMKPTSVVVMLLYLAHPRALKKIKENFAWGTLSVVVGVIYYTVGLKQIAKFQEGPALFATAFHPFLSSLLAFFSDVKNWTNMWMYRPFFSLGILIILPLSITAIVQKKPGYQRLFALWGVLLAQYILMAGLAGPHGFIHDYYFLGLAPTSALILWWLLSQNWPKWIPALIFVGMMVPTLELTSMDLRPLYKSDRKPQLAKACEALKSRHPEMPWKSGAVFRSTDEEYPSLGLCFGEREASRIASFGFFWNEKPVPSECQIIDSEGLVSLAKCAR